MNGARLAIVVVGLILLISGLAVGAATPNLIACSPGTYCNNRIGNLVGYVTNTSSANGIVGASVKLLVSGTTTYSTLTTTSGYYKFGGIAAGGYNVNVTASGYKSTQGTVVVSAGATAVFNAALAPVSSSGSSGGTGCSPTPTGGGCTTPPPPPGVTPPPPPPAPSSNITATNTTGNLTLKVTCSPGSGGLVSCLANATGGTAPYNYSYAFGDGATATGASVTHIYTLNGAYLITASVTDHAGTHVVTSAGIQVSGFGPVAIGLMVLGFVFVAAGVWPRTRGRP